MQIQEPSETAPERFSAGTKHRVLIVDDNKDFADSLGDLLTAENYEVRIAYSVAAGRAEIKKFDADIAVLDFKLDDGDGFDLFEILKEHHPDLICILLTAFSDPKFGCQNLASWIC